MLRLRPVRLSWRVIDDQVVVLDMAREEYFTVNPTGGVMWELLVEGATKEQLVAALTARFDVDVDTAERDATDFVSSLKELRLLE
jgi:hypothetical protein